ncbi:hypothetical protein ES705_45966 [subsurface metagenome]
MVQYTPQAVQLTCTPAIGVAHSAILRATPAISPGINFVKSEFRQFDIILTADTSPADIKDEYIAKFGIPGAVGMQVFIQAYQINWNTGQAGLPRQASTLII